MELLGALILHGLRLQASTGVFHQAIESREVMEPW